MCRGCLGRPPRRRFRRLPPTGAGRGGLTTSLEGGFAVSRRSRNPSSAERSRHADAHSPLPVRRSSPSAASLPPRSVSGFRLPCASVPFLLDNRCAPFDQHQPFRSHERLRHPFSAAVAGRWSCRSGNILEAQQPVPNVVRHLLERAVKRFLPVDRAHIVARRNVAHDEIDGHLVARRAANGGERAAQRRERSDALAIEPECLDPLAKLRADRVNGTYISLTSFAAGGSDLVARLG